MTTDTDLVKLYSGRILALAADIPNVGRLDAPEASVKKRSPLCGSTVTVDVVSEAGRVTELGLDVKACALGQASSAVFGKSAIGTTREQIERGRDQLRAMLKEDGPVPDAPFDGLEALVPARDFKNRHASILLVFEAAADAMATVESAA
ncbi:iron-sulfur cluster assembly scaffold protein [Roseicyclus sp. F158]|uniref:Iron-sulfur cluster assembly scaffold protein n=1 Tax=Tropicimonas omnivorans TaxID=3075590 RepID=A0ABU3DJV9_9RHOB|nr:iron-sulfur cluster assembly scaffold protein [Roseicyclus sp. F158]MDT0684010.1 iron-sulfur cluster assembly scaffold protein [Roseicyclus sp. F158]